MDTTTRRSMTYEEKLDMIDRGLQRRGMDDEESRRRFLEDIRNPPKKKPPNKEIDPFAYPRGLWSLPPTAEPRGSRAHHETIASGLRPRSLLPLASWYVHIDPHSCPEVEKYMEKVDREREEQKTEVEMMRQQQKLEEAAAAQVKSGGDRHDDERQLKRQGLEHHLGSSTEPQLT
ncbi:hypothetical protein E2562_025925 [Oryza meyeriana var. granulata]|uniref:Uncharacterized protein n=1 Tax=Oryza meyeriana var. granulata TaxID=110450 RepID=A0A6G1EYT0_9ORYZ|nr:hypothetical protein E2562_025925 [Oryza meyeriana var. granulata]